jgi:hypothetical protein
LTPGQLAVLAAQAAAATNIRDALQALIDADAPPPPTDSPDANTQAMAAAFAHMTAALSRPQTPSQITVNVPQTQVTTGDTHVHMVEGMVQTTVEANMPAAPDVHVRGGDVTLQINAAGFYRARGLN